MKDSGKLPQIGEISEQQIKEVLEEGFEPRKLEDKNNIQQITENKSKSILGSAEEAIEADGTRIGEVNKEASIIKAKEQDREHTDTRKDSNDLGLDDE